MKKLIATFSITLLLISTPSKGYSVEQISSSGMPVPISYTLVSPTMVLALTAGVLYAEADCWRAVLDINNQMGRIMECAAMSVSAPTELPSYWSDQSAQWSQNISQKKQEILKSIELAKPDAQNYLLNSGNMTDQLKNTIELVKSINPAFKNVNDRNMIRLIAVSE